MKGLKLKFIFDNNFVMSEIITETVIQTNSLVLTKDKLTCPRSKVRLTSLYWVPEESGGLCHQRSDPSIAWVAGCAFLESSELQ